MWCPRSMDAMLQSFCSLGRQDWAVGRHLICFNFLSTCSSYSGSTKNLSMCRLSCCSFGNVADLARENTKVAVLIGCQNFKQYSQRREAWKQHLRVLNEDFIHADSFCKPEKRERLFKNFNRSSDQQNSDKELKSELHHVWT